MKEKINTITDVVKQMSCVEIRFLIDEIVKQYHLKAIQEFTTDLKIKNLQ